MHPRPEESRSAVNRFELTLPAETAHLQLVRLNAAAVTSDLLNVEEIEDVKVAIEELTAVLMQPDDGEPDLHLSFVVNADSVVVSGRRGLRSHAALAVHDFLSTILDAVCDDHELVHETGQVSFRFEKTARGR